MLQRYNSMQQRINANRQSKNKVSRTCSNSRIISPKNYAQLPTKVSADIGLCVYACEARTGAYKRSTVLNR